MYFCATMNRPVRTRFAPSPTGALHLGGVRTALYCYLFAKKHNGQFLLRIEDTDQSRYVAGAEQYIVEALNWAGLHYDEGVDIGGPFAPYRQSDRKNLYQNYVHELLNSGNAYYAFDTTEELENKRNQFEANGKTFKYDVHTRYEMKNSLTLDKQTVETLLKQGAHYVIRFMIPKDETITFYDTIRETVTYNSNELDDKVLMKSDGMPTYHLANVVDDYLMQISHVIRGEEWLPSTPLHILLYRAFGWQNYMPEFAHLPLILKPDGKGKLSKRDGDRLGFPVFPINWLDPTTNELSIGFRERGFLPPAFINMLAFVGWNPGTEQEIFSKDELVQSFDLSRVSKHGAKFDFEKAKWFNAQYIRKMSNEELTHLIQPLLNEKKWNTTTENLLKMIDLLKERFVFHHDFLSQAQFFFETIKTYDEQTIQKKYKAENQSFYNSLIQTFELESDYTVSVLEPIIKKYITESGKGLGETLPLIRIALMGNLQGPDLFKSIEILGKEEVILRLKKGMQYMQILSKGN